MCYRRFRIEPILVFLVAMSTILSPTLARGQQTQGPSEMRLLTAVGTAEVRVRPDLAEVRLGVETEARTASEARQQNASRAGRVINAVKALGIPEQAIQTSVFQIFPVRRFPPDQRPQTGEPPIVGYQVTNIVSVRTEQFDLVPRIIDESVNAGANRVDSVNFILQDEAMPRRTALRQAVANARQNADEMAKELGVKLVRVQNVQQGGAGLIPPPIAYRAGGFEALAAPTPIFPGEVAVSASATLTYVIE